MLSRAVGCAAAALLASTSPLLGAPGDLDPSFGTGGKVLTPLSHQSDDTREMAVAPDGKLVVVGNIVRETRSDGATLPNFLVVRYTPDGALDNTFDGDGFVSTNVGGFTSDAGAVAVQPDGKIIAVGPTTRSETSPGEWGIVRYNVDGSLDASFGDGGRVIRGEGQPTAVAVKGDGKIVVAGHAGGGRGWVVMVMNPDGTPDTSFSDDSRATLEFPPAPMTVRAVAVQPDGKILVAGSVILGFSDYSPSDSLIARYKTDGSLDSTFGNGAGYRVYEGFPEESDTFQNLIVLPSGKILASRAEGGNFAVARLNPDSSPDASFGSGGFAGKNFGGEDNPWGLALQPDGKIVQAGFTRPSRGDASVALVRYTPDGDLDQTFGDGGSLISIPGIAWDAVIQPNGRIAVRGSLDGNKIGLLGFLPDDRVPPRPLPRFWVAGRDLAENERMAAANETAATNAVFPQWSYGYRSTVEGTAFTPFGADAHTNSYLDRPAVQGWSSSSGVVVANTGREPVQFFSGNQPFMPLHGEQLLVKRSSTATMPVVRWTAPENGAYKISAKWHDMDPVNRGGAAHVLIDGVQVFGRQENGKFIGQDWPDDGNAMMPIQTFYLNAGTVVDFVLSTRAGDASTDSTAFSAFVVRVPSVAITNPNAGEITIGQNATVPVTVGLFDYPFPVEKVQLLVDGQKAGAPDAEPPYDFTLSNLSFGSHYLTAEVTDFSGTVTTSAVSFVFDNQAVTPEPLKIIVNAGGAAARNARGKTGETIAAVASIGGTFTCTQSGPWADAATWGGQGVPGQDDHAIIPAGVEVDLQDAAREIGSIDVAGGLVAPVRPESRTFLGVRGTMQASGYIRGALVHIFGQFVNVARPVRLESAFILNQGGIFVGLNGSILGDTNSILKTTGSYTNLASPGTNRPSFGKFNNVLVEGGQVKLGNFAQLIAPGGIVAVGGMNLIGADGASIISKDGAGIISKDGAGIITHDGASLIGADGATLIGADGASLVGNNGNTIITHDGASLIGADGASLVGDNGNTFGPRTSAAMKEFDVSARRASAGDRIVSAAGAGEIMLEGGTVSGFLNLIGDVVNRGAFIAPGSSPGMVAVFGDYTQEANGTLVLETGGKTLGQFDLLQVAGTAKLGGNLIVNAINGFTGADAISPLTYNSATGNFASISSNAQVAFNSTGMTLQVSGPNPPAPKALNIATRMRVETGDNVLIAGFIITGDHPKRVLVRGIGPSLPVAGALADPTLELDGGALFNDDWRSDQQGEIEGTTIPPASDLEAAIVATLEPGAHTAVLRGKNNGAGVGLVEVYDLESGSPVQLANISTRGQVQTGDNVMIGGFIIGGDYPAKVLLRAIGPSLPVEGALQDPTLELVDSNGAIISNDNWRATQEAEIIGTTVPPSDNSEAAILATLVPGAYTAVVRGKDDTTGVALVEGYTLP